MQVLYLTMAFLTLQTVADMALVVEKNMLGNTVYLDPGGWRSGIIVAVLDLDPGMIGNDVVVAVQAFFHCRQSRMIGVVDIRMAEATLNVFNPGMYVVTEWNRLFRTDLGGRRKPERINKKSDKSRSAQRQQNGYSIAFQDDYSFVLKHVVIKMRDCQSVSLL